MKRHSVEEITTKLRQAEQLMAGGQSQTQACKGLGVSVMTYHRWRKLHPARERRELAAPKAASRGDDPVSHRDAADQEQKLRIENERLRRIVTDVLLEKVRIEEQIALGPNGKSLRRNPAGF
jgi:putative transposase